MRIFRMRSPLFRMQYACEIISFSCEIWVITCKQHFSHVIGWVFSYVLCMWHICSSHVKKRLPHVTWRKIGKYGGENHLSHPKIIKFRMRFTCFKHASYMWKPQISCARMVYVSCMRLTCKRCDFACGIFWILICEKGKFYMRYTCIMHVKEQCFRNIIACENR